MLAMPMMAGLPLARTTPPLGDGMMVAVGAIMARTMVVGEECRMSRGVRATRIITNLTSVAALAAAILVAGTTVAVVAVALAIPATITSSKSEAMRILRSIVRIVGVVHRRQPLYLRQEGGANRPTMLEVVPWLDLTRQCILPELDDMAMLALFRLPLA